MDALKRGKSASVHYGFSQKSSKSCYLLKRFGKEKNLIFQGLPGTKKGDLKADDNKLSAEQRSPKYIKNIHGILHRALDMAMRVEYLTKNPSTYTIRPKVMEKPVVPLDAPEQKSCSKR